MKSVWQWLLVMIVLVLGYLALAHLREKPEGGDFTLTRESGTLSLHDFTGKWVVLYFGYATCPDVCPTNLGLWSQAFRGLSANERAQVQFVFISLDGERDTPKQLTRYVHYFDESFMAATGNDAVITRVAKQYGVKWAKVISDTALGYTLDHSSYSYLVDPQGKLVRMFRHATPSDQLLQALQQSLSH